MKRKNKNKVHHQRSWHCVLYIPDNLLLIWLLRVYYESWLKIWTMSKNNRDSIKQCVKSTDTDDTSRNSIRDSNTKEYSPWSRIV